LIPESAILQMGLQHVGKSPEWEPPPKSNHQGGGGFAVEMVGGFGFGFGIALYEGKLRVL